MRTATRALAVLPLVLVLAACGANGAAPSSAASPSASTGALAPVGSAGASDSPAPSVDIHGAADLEARLPDQIGGTTLTKVSLTGADFLSTGTSAEQGDLETR